MAESSASPSPSSLLARFPIYYGWVVVAVAAVTMAIGVNSRTAFSLLFPPILLEFGWERGVTAAAFSIGFIASTMISPFVGALMDRFGPRYIIPAGALLVSGGLSLSTFATTPVHLYLTLGVLVVGSSVLLSYIGHSFFLPFWFVRRRGLAIGLAFSGVGVGSIFLFPWLQGIIDASGWRQACWTMATMLVVVLIPLNFLLQRRRPEDLGLAPDGDGGRRGEGGRVEGGAGRAMPDNIVDRAWAEREWTIGIAMRTGRFWWLFAGYAAGLYGWYAVQVHQTQYLIDAGFPGDEAAFALGFVGFMGIFGMIGIGHLSDRIGREWAWMISALGFALCYVLLMVIRNYPAPWLVYLMVASQGLLGYGMASVYGAIPAELFQGKGYGAIFGMFGVAAGIGAGGGPWLTGLIHDLMGDYRLAFSLAMALSLASIVCVWMAAPRKVRLVAGQAARRMR